MEENKSFKVVAKEAKLRFKRGFWKEYNIKKEIKLEEAKGKGLSAKDAIKIQTEIAKREIKKQFDKKSEDDIFYEKVAEILSSDEIILNPIKRLVDESEFEGLGENEKQLYILNLTTKFNQMKEKFNKEKLLS